MRFFFSPQGCLPPLLHLRLLVLPLREREGWCSSIAFNGAKVFTLTSSGFIERAAIEHGPNRTSTWEVAAWCHQPCAAAQVPHTCDPFPPCALLFVLFLSSLLPFSVLPPAPILLLSLPPTSLLPPLSSSRCSLVKHIDRSGCSQVRRSLYIDDQLFTISDGEIRATSLTSYALLWTSPLHLRESLAREGACTINGEPISWERTAASGPAIFCGR